MAAKKSSPAKKAPAKKAPTKKVQRWSLGLFRSAANGGDPVVLYCTVAGVVSSYYAKKVASKQALFHASYVGVTYAQARAKLLADAAKGNGKTRRLLADAAKADASQAKEPAEK